MVRVSVDGKILKNVEMITMSGNYGVIVKIAENEDGSISLIDGQPQRQSIIFDPIATDIRVIMKSK